MTNSIEDLIQHLEDPAFQSQETGRLFHPTYIYTYLVEDEYEMQEQLQLILQRLKRPTHFLDCLLINLFDELVAYLKSNRLFDTTVFNEILKKEEKDPIGAQKWIVDKVDDERFIEYITLKIKTHFDGRNNKAVYLLINGVGEAFPYLRGSDFLKRIESLSKNFKVILFYPGEYRDKYYNLFGQLKTDNIYRANLLNQLI